MSSPSGEACGYCYFCADPDAVQDGHGWCKRYPPPFQSDEDHEKHPPWTPLVSLTSWCGEFRLHPDMTEHFRKQLRMASIRSHQDEGPA